MRCDPDEKTLWKMAADAKGMTLSALVRSLLNKAAIHILIDEVEQDRYNGQDKEDSEMKHLAKPENNRISMCGLPYAPRERPDGTRRAVNWPEISDVSTCKACNWYDAMKKEALKVAE